ncbi:MAG: alpha-1,2-fucosyltransferase [Proteobacteria bacterium]|nr:alpha-1,2-fucosyltransferase [Pseudomonadota bacterium]
MSSKIGTIWFLNYPKGGFANAAFQAMFAEYLRNKIPCEVIVGHPQRSSDEAPWAMFNLPNHHLALRRLSQEEQIETMSLGENRSMGPAGDLRLIETFFAENPGDTLAINGWFQYDTSFFKNDQVYYQAFNDTLSLESPPKTRFQQSVNSLREQLVRLLKGNYLTAIHVRRGDYLKYENHKHKNVFYQLDLNNTAKKLNNFLQINRIKNPILYIASDDLEYCSEFFSNKGIEIVTSRDLLEKEEFEGDPMNALLCDIAVLSAANCFVSSNSSLSILSSLINTGGRVFLRQTFEKELVFYDPWNTPILYNWD